VAFGHTLLAYDSCLRGPEQAGANPAALARDLDDAWEVLAEPIQTVMRRYGLPEPYEQLKAFTRGDVDAAEFDAAVLEASKRVPCSWISGRPGAVRAAR
jgi:adenylosuccinate lyase